jgi:hypothetical protein
MFPRALEILLDFTFFDIDDGKHFTDNNHQRIISEQQFFIMEYLSTK